MEKIPCVDCLVFPICRNKTEISILCGISIEIININISSMIQACSQLRNCLGKSNLFEKKRIKRIQLLKHILNIKTLSNKKIYRLYIDNPSSHWLDQFKGESLDYDKSLYDKNFGNFKTKRRRANHGNVRSKTR